MLANLEAEIQAARLVLYHSAWLSQNKYPCTRETAMAKLLTTELAKKSALEVLQVHGGNGYAMEYDIQRYVRDSLILPIGGGTSQIMRNWIASNYK
jgi:alkylation response protein AidB-like acyl-CoA dehydrogenase